MRIKISFRAIRKYKLFLDELNSAFTTTKENSPLAIDITVC
jgi:hypothetical protein